MRKAVLFICVCLFAGVAFGQDAKKLKPVEGVERQKPVVDKIVEGGVEYYRVRNLNDLKQIGFNISDGNNAGYLLAAAKGHRGGRNSCCNFNKGRCSSLLRVSAGGDIISANFVEEETSEGKVVKTKNNLMPYYNGKVNKDVLFR